MWWMNPTPRLACKLVGKHGKLLGGLVEDTVYLWHGEAPPEDVNASFTLETSDGGEVVITGSDAKHPRLKGYYSVIETSVASRALPGAGKSRIRSRAVSTQQRTAREHFLNSPRKRSRKWREKKYLNKQRRKHLGESERKAVFESMYVAGALVGDVFELTASPEGVDADTLFDILCKAADMTGVVSFKILPDAPCIDAVVELVSSGDLEVTGEDTYTFSNIEDAPDEEDEEEVEESTAPICVEDLWVKFVYDTNLAPEKFNAWVQENYPSQVHLLSQVVESSGQRYSIPKLVRENVCKALTEVRGGLDGLGEYTLACMRALLTENQLSQSQLRCVSATVAFAGNGSPDYIACGGDAAYKWLRPLANRL
jgi:hypothetical protein